MSPTGWRWRRTAPSRCDMEAQKYLASSSLAIIHTSRCWCKRMISVKRSEGFTRHVSHSTTPAAAFSLQCLACSRVKLRAPQPKDILSLGRRRSVRPCKRWIGSVPIKVIQSARSGQMPRGSLNLPRPRPSAAGVL